MESFMSWAKENFDLISLYVGLLGVVIAVIALVYEIRGKKRKNKGKK